MSFIATSIIASSDLQIDGHYSVHEQHTDTVGAIHDIWYFAAPTDNQNALLTSHAGAVSASLTVGEISNNISGVSALGSLFSPTFNFSTTAANIAALRQAYNVANQLQVIMIGDFLNTLTLVQLESIFGLNLAQATALQTNYLAPYAAHAAAIRAASGQ